MEAPSNLLAPDHQEEYFRAREDPFFDGMRKRDASVRNRAPITGFQGKATKQDISQSASDIGDRGSRKILMNISDNVTHSLSKDPPLDMISDPFLTVRSLRTPEITFPLTSTKSDLRIDFQDENDKLMKQSSFRASETDVESYALTSLRWPAIERSYSMNRRSTNISGIPLPPSAASFYNGYSPDVEIVESCESIHRLNMYLKARRDDVNAGAPGRFLHVVMGQDISDIGSVASTISYAFYLNETLKNDQFCTVPVVNMKRADLNSHSELKWLLESCNIDQASLIFFDEIDLSYYDLFGSLKIVLLNDDKLPTKQEALKEAVVEAFNCRKDSSCCTIIAEKFAVALPEILAGKGFSQLLLAGILLDTGNLTNPHCTSTDKYMATLLINGAGRFGCSGLYQILRYKMYDVSDLKVGEILRKDFKKWTRIGKPENAGSRLMVSHVGMSSIGISIARLLAHDNMSTQEIVHFQRTEKLRLLMVVSGYYDPQKNFKREILVSAESAELMNNLLHFFNSNASNLPLKVLQQPGLRDEMRVFEIDKVTSRKTIERLLEEFGGSARR